MPADRVKATHADTGGVTTFTRKAFDRVWSKTGWVATDTDDSAADEPEPEPTPPAWSTNAAEHTTDASPEES